MIVGRNRKEICCKWCGKVFDEPGEILKYKGNYYCGDGCLGEYLVDQAEEEIEEVWIDTEENMEFEKGDRYER